MPKEITFGWDLARAGGARRARQGRPVLLSRFNEEHSEKLTGIHLQHGKLHRKIQPSFGKLLNFHK